ncbi:hypothetical protein DSO57_1011106 [Entomophthora muscae]|uniref:Uncharacterized protein n=1 Tax=Entomophthora muscae TaxID=34485 RepID=A0ACC2T6J2_9FUNG|nr:hypothetical protein DSO57_1011106 [Entomophthora muscae]
MRDLVEDAALRQYQDLVYGIQNTLEGKRARLLFLETQVLDWLCEALTQEYYQYIKSHALSNVEEAYVLICCLGRFKTHGQLFHSSVAPEPAVKAKPERKATMPLPAADINCNRCGKEGHPFIYCPTLRASEAKVPTSEAKPPKTKSSKPKKEANSSSAKDETYLLESLATYIPIALLRSSKAKSAIHENLAAGDQPQQLYQHDVSQQEPAAEPYEVPIDEENDTYHEAPTIEVQKYSSLKTSSQKSQQTNKSKPKPAVPLPVVKLPKFNILKTLTDIQAPISMYNLAEIEPSFGAQKIQYLGTTCVHYMPEQFNMDQTALLDQAEKSIIDVVSEGAPLIDSEVEVNPKAIILDGGSTSNIISEAFIRLLGVQKYSQGKEKFTFANSNTEKCLWFLKDLTIEISGVSMLVLSAIF